MAAYPPERPTVISVEVRAPDLGMVPHWEALARRAGNVFMHPAALCAAATAGFVKIHVLLAWDEGKLVGLWGLRERRVAPFWSFLAAPPYDYAFVSSPVIDPDHAPAVMPAFFDAIENDPALPNVIKLQYLDGDCEILRAMTNALSARKGQMLTLSERARPFLGNESERKRSGSTGKKLRQDWNRLSALGAVDIANDRSTESVRAAFEIFLLLEAKSWKGASGTALLSEEDDAAFARRLIGDLGRHGHASVSLLRLNGKPIAAQVLLRAGRTAYTWKTAFDADFSRFSPGALLVDKATDVLFADGIEQIESCSPEGSFMAQLWAGRRTTVDMLVDVGPAKSLSFTLCATAERLYALLRAQRDRLRAFPWIALPKRKNLAVTRS
jgi:CelD/BcsL family acetyltransferase involved in cellulose biosynthesis